MCALPPLPPIPPKNSSAHVKAVLRTVADILATSPSVTVEKEGEVAQKKLSKSRILLQVLIPIKRQVLFLFKSVYKINYKCNLSTIKT